MLTLPLGVSLQHGGKPMLSAPLYSCWDDGRVTMLVNTDSASGCVSPDNCEPLWPVPLATSHGDEGKAKAEIVPPAKSRRYNSQAS